AHDLPHAWNYFRLIGEPGPVRDAFNDLSLADDEESYPLVDIAFHQGVNPRKGFDIVLDRQGVCSAITLLGNFESALAPDVRAYCVGQLVRPLHDHLVERLRAEIAEREGATLPLAGLPELMAGRDWLFDDEFYHIDVSHLSSVVQMSI